MFSINCLIVWIRVTRSGTWDQGHRWYWIKWCGLSDISSGSGFQDGFQAPITFPPKSSTHRRIPQNVTSSSYQGDSILLLLPISSLAFASRINLLLFRLKRCDEWPLLAMVRISVLLTISSRRFSLRRKHTKLDTWRFHRFWIADEIHGAHLNK